MVALNDPPVPNCILVLVLSSDISSPSMWKINVLYVVEKSAPFVPLINSILDTAVLTSTVDNLTKSDAMPVKFAPDIAGKVPVKSDASRLVKLLPFKAVKVPYVIFVAGKSGLSVAVNGIGVGVAPIKAI